jgi:hypothetical protein
MNRRKARFFLTIQQAPEAELADLTFETANGRHTLGPLLLDAGGTGEGRTAPAAQPGGRS